MLFLKDHFKILNIIILNVIPKFNKCLHVNNKKFIILLFQNNVSFSMFAKNKQYLTTFFILWFCKLNNEFNHISLPASNIIRSNFICSTCK